MQAWKKTIGFPLAVAAALWLTPAAGENARSVELDPETWAKRLAESYGPAWIEGRKESEKKKTAQTDAVFTPLWLPMCFFFDPAVDVKTANEKVKGMVAAYGSCGIALKPYAFTIRPNYPADAAEVVRLAMEACPIPTVFGVRGAIQIETRHRELPGQMCRDPQARGCSTLCEPLSVSMTGLNTGLEVGLHESLHSNCCGPLCVDRGAGAGRPTGSLTEMASIAIDTAGRFHAMKTTRIWDQAVTAEGCKALQAGASENKIPHWYQPLKTTYYTGEANAAYFYDLLEGKSFFGPDGEPRVLRDPAETDTVDSNQKGIIQKLLTAIEGDGTEGGLAPPSGLTTLSAIRQTRPRPPLRAPAARVEPVEPYDTGLPLEPMERKRGAGLRKEGDPRRKPKNTVGVVDGLYEGGGDGEAVSAH